MDIKKVKNLIIVFSEAVLSAETSKLPTTIRNTRPVTSNVQKLENVLVISFEVVFRVILILATIIILIYIVYMIKA